LELRYFLRLIAYLPLKNLSNTTKTVLVLVGVILISGLTIPQAYLRYIEKREFRPPFEKALTKNIQILDDLRGATSLSEYQGHIWLAYCTSSQEENANVLLHQKVAKLRAKFPDETIKTAIFVVDATIEQKDTLSAYRQSFSEFLTEDDYVIAANVRVLQKYLKNEFRFALLPYEKDGLWLYDHDLIILDRMPVKESGVGAVLAHLRGHLNFTKAIELDQQAIKENKPNAPFEEQLNKILVDSIQYFIDNPDEEDPLLSGEQ